MPELGSQRLRLGFGKGAAERPGLNVQLTEQAARLVVLFFQPAQVLAEGVRGARMALASEEKSQNGAKCIISITKKRISGQSFLRLAYELMLQTMIVPLPGCAETWKVTVSEERAAASADPAMHRVSQ